MRSVCVTTVALSGPLARHATVHTKDGHGPGAGIAMLASRTRVSPTATVNARTPRSATVAPLGSDGSGGIGGRDAVPTGGEPDPDARDVGVALGTTVALGSELVALPDGRAVDGTGEVVAAPAAVVGASDAVVTARGVSVQARTKRAWATMSARSALRVRTRRERSVRVRGDTAAPPRG